MLVLDPDLGDEQFDAFLEKITKYLSDRKGEIVKLSKWGLQTLAYPIKRKDKGQYLLLYWSGEPQLSRDFERSLRLMEEVLRYLILKSDENISVVPAESEITEAEPETPEAIPVAEETP
jgi:small subunit ribosomal protein S6